MVPPVRRRARTKRAHRGRQPPSRLAVAAVTQLAEPLDITLAAVTQHLRVLEQGGVVRTEKVGA